jgi:23S rRNA (cytidine1920-2'-O)/16S rRNA (cytidine1409-2'-O)-methyltransferase
MTRVRADQRLVECGLAPTRTNAQALILAGQVYVGTERVEKAGQLVAADATMGVREALKYVSRGGVKLEGALADFAFDVTGLRCLDVGASTGGFTDCLLAHGAAHVVAVDVGYGQLADKLRLDRRVTVRERTNARSLTADAIGGACDLTVVDASFIGLGALLPSIARCTSDDGHLLALIKPQFEAGREAARKAKGVIRDAATRRAAIDSALRQLEPNGFSVRHVADCRLPGPKGNVEAFVLASKSAACR